MCISNNALERQAYVMCEKIRKYSIYRPLRLDFINGKSIELQKQQLEDIIISEQLPLISKIILEDINGLHFEVEPDENGLNFAKGAITFEEYKQIKSKESKMFIGYFLALSSGLFLLGWVTLRLFFI